MDTPGAIAKLQDKETCGLASTMQTLQDISGQRKLGTSEAFEYIFNTYTSPACTATYCPCKGVGDDGDHCDNLCKDGYCDDAAVVHFCGDGGAEAGDPSQFLCKRTDSAEVGYVRAYLQMFLDCVEVFQGNGCSQGSKEHGNCVEEFIALPNPEISKQTAIQELVSDMPGSCTPDSQRSFLHLRKVLFLQPLAYSRFARARLNLAGMEPCLTVPLTAPDLGLCTGG